jgi:ABC-type cobalamin/Fe3+-siderophores transport system ATPase subunit
MNPIVDIRDITVSYRESIALNSVSLNIDEGEFVVIAGPNGAGKTTLLTAINGLGRLLRGSVSILGIRMNAKSANRIRRDIGYVPQMLTIDPRMPMSVREVVMLGRCGRTGLFKRLSLQDITVVEEVIDLIGLRNFVKRPIGHLSGGEQKKVAIARALAQQPRIILLDEPLSNLDIKAQANILKLIDTIHRRRRLTTVMVMHHLDLLPRNCSRMVLLKNARIIFDGLLSSGLKEEVLSTLYDCPVEIINSGYGIIVRAKGRVD